MMAISNIIRRGGISTLAHIFDTHSIRFGVRVHVPITTALFGIIQFKSTDIDVLDVFTTNILSNKPSKAANSQTEIETTETTASQRDRGEMLRKVSAERQNKTVAVDVVAADSKLMPLNLETWSQNEIDNYLMVAMDCDDRNTLAAIVQQIVQHKCLPSDAIILRLLCHLCNDSDDSMATISAVIDLCGELNVAFYAKNMEFAPFLSQYLWKLERFDDALSTLNTFYPTANKSHKQQILRNYRQIIYDAVKNQNETIVDRVVAHAEHIQTKYNDPILIVYVWSDCFFSELYRCQRLANQLFATHSAIRTSFGKNVHWIALTLLQQHNIDGIHRLIEVCLASKLMKEVHIVLTALFEYQCKQRFSIFDFGRYNFSK